MARAHEERRARGAHPPRGDPRRRTSGTPLEVFGTNVEATFVALEAAGDAGVERVSLASSISLLGLPFGAGGLAPLYAPVDEAHPNIGTRPVRAVQGGRRGDRRDDAAAPRLPGGGAPHLGDGARWTVHLARMAEVAEDPADLARELWAYLDVRDGARAFALAVERDIPGFHVINVMAPDTYSALPTAELMARYHPVDAVAPAAGRPRGPVRPDALSRTAGVLAGAPAAASAMTTAAARSRGVARPGDRTAHHIRSGRSPL